MMLLLLLLALLVSSHAWAAVAHETSSGANVANDCADGSVSVSPPSGLASGDLWIIMASADTGRLGTEAMADISGFTALAVSQKGTGDWPITRMWYKIAGASESAVNVTTAAGCFWGFNYATARLSGVNNSTPLDTSAVPGNASGAATSTDVTNLTVAANGSMAIGMFTYANNTAPTIPSGSTSITTQGTPGFGAVYQAVNAGTFDPSAWTHASSGNRIIQWAVFAPSGGATVVPKMSLMGVGP